VPLSKRLGLGTIVGYLVAGILAGVALGSGLWGHPEDLLHFAEFGVVLFLFVIGLEFRPARLWEARATIFGRGTMQVLVCGGLLAVPPWLLGLPWQASLVIGLGLSLSSTALVLQALDADGERSSAIGRTAIAILLFEDLAIVPLLLLVTLLSATGGDTGWADALRATGLGLAAILLLIAIGRYALEPMFRVLARARLPEIMTASALGLVIAASLLMDAVGLSYAMGAFIAGVMLAESSYRHEVEADIEPFRGLFLGLFFLAVGLSLDLGVLAADWPLILVAVPVCVALKALGIYGVSRLFRSGHRDAARLAAKLSQHGEFGFVLFAAAAASGLFDGETASILVSIVSLSMAASAMVDRLGSRLVGDTPRRTLAEDFSDAGGPVLVIGFGRFGQLVAQPLLA
jgi:monovalent cation:proton antiporter-2 (CPA2) family protein